MNFDDQLRRYFGSTGLDGLAPETIVAGVEKMRVDFGLETDRNRRFALWSLLFLLGDAPDIDTAFADSADRDAARNFMDLIDKAD